MSFIHYLYLGHFQHDGAMVRFTKDPCSHAYKPVVSRAIDTETLTTVLREVQGGSAEELIFPEGWEIWKDDGYLISHKYTNNREVIAFVVSLVERAHCEIYDVGAHHDITLDEWLAAIHDYSGTGPSGVK